eukprot:6481561-Amphidinium_carterae.1
MLLRLGSECCAYLRFGQSVLSLDGCLWEPSLGRSGQCTPTHRNTTCDALVLKRLAMSGGSRSSDVSGARLHEELLQQPSLQTPVATNPAFAVVAADLLI